MAPSEWIVRGVSLAVGVLLGIFVHSRAQVGRRRRRRRHCTAAANAIFWQLAICYQPMAAFSIIYAALRR